MSSKPTIHTYFDNREGRMTPRESSKFFNCDYDPIHKEIRIAFLSECRTLAKNQSAIESGRTFLCGCCKRPLKIVGGVDNGKKCFHFMHINTPGKDECDYYEKVPYNGDEIKAMIFNGRTESIEHKITKNVIATALRSDPDVVNVAVEEVVKKVGKTWRKPDIRTDFKDKTVVFEVQLSPIFHHVILERNDAYRDNGWYICWVFDDVNDDDPIMRKLDAWVNNNYNLFGFDETAKNATEASGCLYLTVKYFEFRVIEDGINSRLDGEWYTETVPFSELTFDSEQHMVYLHDSNTEKEKCIIQISSIISARKNEIEEENKRLEEKKEVLNFIYNIPNCEFSTDKFLLLLEYLPKIDEDDVDVLLSKISTRIKSFEFGALNKWLKVVCEIVRERQVGFQTAKYLWTETIYAIEDTERKIGYLSILDYISVWGEADYTRVLSRLLRPFDDETSTYLDAISPSNERFIYYSPLLLLNRYYQKKRNVPQRLLDFFSSGTREVWCLISAQMGKPFGYDDLQNLKQISNLVWNSFQSIARLFLYLIERNGFVNIVSEVKYKNGRLQKSQYQKLKELIASQKNQQMTGVTIEDLEILFPPRNKENK